VSEHVGIRHHEKAAVRLARLCGTDGFELGHVAHGRHDRLHSEGRGGGFEGIQVNLNIRGSFRVIHGGDPRDTRCNLLEQLEPFADHARLEIDEASDVATWPRQTRDKAAADRIDNVRENDGGWCAFAAVVLQL
jgi:hypothetical protein